MTRSAIIAALFAVAGSASAQFSVTEVFVGLSGEDGTNDWFEITNTGAGVFDTGTLFYDDENPNATDGGQLDSFLLAPGESAVFLIADNATDFEDDSAENAAADLFAQFANVWGTVANVGITNGGGGLSQNGDEINISTDGGSSFLFTLAFDNTFANSGATFETFADPRNSVAGVRGAYESNAFFNNNNPYGAADGNPSEMVTVVGSPGIVPAPASAALLGLGGLITARRRR